MYYIYSIMYIVFIECVVYVVWVYRIYRIYITIFFDLFVKKVVFAGLKNRIQKMNPILQFLLNLISNFYYIYLTANRYKVILIILKALIHSRFRYKLLPL